LAALTINSRLLAEHKADEYLIQLFGSEGNLTYNWSGELKDRIDLLIGHMMALLIKARILPTADALAEVLPFEVKTGAFGYAKGYLAKPMRHYHNHLAYAVGILRCAQLVSSNKMTLRDLIQQPIENRKLKRIAERAYRQQQFDTPTSTA
jgi:hypothetical protein